MKIVTLILTLTMVALGAPTHSWEVVPGRSAGPVSLGQDPALLEPVWGPPRRRTAPAEPGQIPDVYFEYPERGVWLLIQQGRVQKLGLESGRWMSQDGTRLWMPEQEIFWLYGRPAPREARSKDHYFLDFPQRGISFLLLKNSRRVVAIHLYPPGSQPEG